MSSEISVVMGSKSDWPTVKQACDILDQFGVKYDKQVISAHRMPNEMFDFAQHAAENGVKVIIACAGGAAHPPGMIAANTPLPVIGIPGQTKALGGMDSLLSIVQMPAGIPVATLAIGKAGAINAALLSASILGAKHPQFHAVLKKFRTEQTDSVLDNPDPREA